jgi:hypothetical protein
MKPHLLDYVGAVPEVLVLVGKIQLRPDHSNIQLIVDPEKMTNYLKNWKDFLF